MFRKLTSLSAITLISCIGIATSCASKPDSDLAGQSANPDAVQSDGWMELKLTTVNRADTSVDNMAHFKTSWHACTSNSADGALDFDTWNALASQVNAAIKLEPLKEDEMYCVDPPTGTKFMDGTTEVVMPAPVAMPSTSPARLVAALAEPMPLPTRTHHPFPFPAPRPSATSTSTPTPAPTAPHPIPTVVPTAHPTNNPFPNPAPHASPSPSPSPSPSISTVKRVLFDYRGGQVCSTIRDHQVSDALLKALNAVVLAADAEGCPPGYVP